MKKTLILTLILIRGFQSLAQNNSKDISFSFQLVSENKKEQPKIVFGIVLYQIHKVYINDITPKFSTILGSSYSNGSIRNPFSEFTE